MRQSAREIAARTAEPEDQRIRDFDGEMPVDETETEAGERQTDSEETDRQAETEETQSKQSRGSAPVH